ncbi:MAG: glycosyltransferase, partial [Bryobacteraceae bacterium]
MRVLYFSRGYTSHDRRFLSALRHHGHDTGFLRLEAPAPDGPPIPEGVVELKGTIEEASRVFQPEITQAGPLLDIAYLAAKAGVRPLAAISWGSDLLSATEAELQQIRFVLDRADAIFCDSEEGVAVARSVSRIDPSRIARFPWGVELTRFTPALVRPQVMQIVSTRAWEPGYGVETVLTAFAVARQKAPQLCLTLCGGGSLAPKIRRFVANNNLSHAVMMPGRVPENELPLYLAAADLYISGTPVDGSSISLLEALATGLPVIAADRPSNREWITPDVNGWLAPRGDVKAFVRAILDAVDASAEQ